MSTPYKRRSTPWGLPQHLCHSDVLAKEGGGDHVARGKVVYFSGQGIRTEEHLPTVTAAN